MILEECFEKDPDNLFVSLHSWQALILQERETFNR